MTFQSWQTITQVLTACGIVLTAIGGYGSYYFQQKIDKEKDESQSPIVDLCHRGIVVRMISNDIAHFDIPYCSGKNANAYNVKLQTAILHKDNNKLSVLSSFEDQFPDNITLTYETGKSISYTLSPFKYNVEDIYICVIGSYTNYSQNRHYSVFDVFKYSRVLGNWVRALGSEDQTVRGFIIDNKIVSQKETP